MSMDYDMNPAPKSQRSYIVTLLLAFFLGPWGIHRFYTGYIIVGILQLLTCGGLGLWTLIDLIALALNKYVDAEGNELEGHNAGCALMVGIVIVFSFIFGGFASVLSLFNSH